MDEKIKVRDLAAETGKSTTDVMRVLREEGIDFKTASSSISREDAEEIIAEMVFVCRCGASPTLVQDALTRRDLPFGRECYLDLITIACEIEPEIRRWEGLGYTGNEVG